MTTSSDPRSSSSSTAPATGSVHDLLLTVRGELDYASSPELLDQAAEALHHRGESTDMAVDCQELTFIDSVGLSALLEIHRDAAAVGVAVHVTGVGPRLEKILRTTGTYTHLTGHDPTEPTD